MDLTPSQPDTNNDSNASDDTKRKLNVLLKEKFGEEERAQLLSESVDDGVGRAHMRRHMRRLLVIVGVLIFLIGVIYWVAIPRYVLALAQSMQVPSQAYGSYKRIIKGYIDYYPVPKNVKTGLADISHSRTFAFQSSADINRDAGMQGTLAIDMNPTDGEVQNADIDLKYQILWQKAANQLYLIFNKWPETFNDIFAPELLNTWFVYDPTKTLAKDDNITKLVAAAHSGSSADFQKLMLRIWNIGITTNTIQWQVRSLLSKDESGRWMTDIGVTVDPMAVDGFVKALHADPEYMVLSKKLLGTDQLDDFLGSLRNASGDFRLGIKDHIVYQVNLNFDSISPHLGSLKGQVSTTMVPLTSPVTMSSIPNARDMGALMTLMQLFPGQSAIATSTTSTNPVNIGIQKVKK